MLVSILSGVVMDSSRGERFGVLGVNFGRNIFLETGSRFFYMDRFHNGVQRQRRRKWSVQ